MMGSETGRRSLLPVRPDIRKVIGRMGGRGRLVLVLAEEEECKVDSRGVNRSTSTEKGKNRSSAKGVKEGETNL